MKFDTKARLYPLFSNISNRKVVVIGGGPVAERKVESLLVCGADVTVISPELTERLEALAATETIAHLDRPYQGGDLDNAWLVIAATDDETINEAVFNEAQERRIFCNIVDVTHLCSFQVPAIVRRGPLQIAVSTGGSSPALARRIREILEKEFDESYVRLLEIMGEMREFLKEKYPDDQKRRQEILENFLDSPIFEAIREKNEQKLQEIINKWKKV